MSSSARTAAPDPITRRADGSYPEVAQAFVEVLSTIDDIVFSLGGTQAARAVVSYAAREATSGAKTRSFNRDNGLWRLGYHMTLCDVFVLGAAGFRGVAQELKDRFRVRSEVPVDLIGRFEDGHLTIRGDRMYYETDSAAVMVGHCYKDSWHRARKEGDERWTTAVTDEAEKLLDLCGFEKPRVGVAHCKSRAAAIKGLMRVAADCFKVELKPFDALLLSSD
jgi:hypothetical protein